MIAYAGGLVHQPVRAENAGCGKEGECCSMRTPPFVVLTVLIANMEPGLQGLHQYRSDHRYSPFIGTVPVRKMDIIKYSQILIL
jgi:hypothetical protein